MTQTWAFLKSDGGRVALAMTAIVVSATTAITTFLLNRKTKRMIFQVIARTRVLSVQKELAGKVQILFEGMPVGHVGLFQIRITNAGSEPIRATDFSRPIRFLPTQGTRILESSIVKASPASMRASLAKDGDGVAIAPTLWNSKDFVEVKLLIENFDGTFSIDSRIEGVELKPGRKKGPLERAIIEILAYGSMLILWPWLGLGLQRRTVVWPALLAVCLGSLVISVWVKRLPYAAEAPNDYR